LQTFLHAELFQKRKSPPTVVFFFFFGWLSQSRHVWGKKKMSALALKHEEEKDDLEVLWRRIDLWLSPKSPCFVLYGHRVTPRFTATVRVRNTGRKVLDLNKVHENIFGYSNQDDAQKLRKGEEVEIEFGGTPTSSFVLNVTSGDCPGYTEGTHADLIGWLLRHFPEAEVTIVSQKFEFSTPRVSEEEEEEEDTRRQDLLFFAQHQKESSQKSLATSSKLLKDVD